MRFGLIYELQLPRPWDANSEHQLVQQALAEVEVADRLGLDYGLRVAGTEIAPDTGAAHRRRCLETLALL
jgi:uncharacterized protein (DUF58 family)